MWHRRDMTIREATPGDLEPLVLLQTQLWPESSAEEHRAHAQAILSGKPRSTLPLAVFVAEAEGRLIGFAEVGLRSHANGCDAARPCGFLEGWYVRPEHRRVGVGRELLDRAEAWCREQGCTEFASDTQIDNEVSRQAHVALGFEVVERALDFRKRIQAAKR
jgi:aminoglycoside 6'-N-acetyltransferase I